MGRAGKTSDPSGCPRVALYATTLKGKPPRRWPLATLDRGRIQRRRGLRPGRENGASAEPENQEMTVREPRSNGIDTGRPVTEARDNPVYRARSVPGRPKRLCTVRSATNAIYHVPEESFELAVLAASD